jgi:hypothetical protein
MVQGVAFQKTRYIVDIQKRAPEFRVLLHYTRGADGASIEALAPDGSGTEDANDPWAITISEAAQRLSGRRRRRPVCPERGSILNGLNRRLTRKKPQCANESTLM